MSRSLDWTPEQSKLVTGLLHRHLPGVKAWAYGSRARWNARPDSDLDLVVFADRSQKAEVSALREALEDSSLPYKVDLFVWDEVPANFRPQIEKERVEVSPLAPASSPVAAGASATPLIGAPPRNAQEWERTTLGKICRDQGGAIQTGPFGSQLHASDYVESGVPVVMPVNIGTDGRLNEAGIERISIEDAKRLSQHILTAGDIVFSRRGDVTRCAYVEAAQVGWFCGTGCLKIRFGNEKKATSRFVAYTLKLPESKEWLIRHAVGATMPNLNTSILGDIPLVLPPLNIQRSITHILGTLDDKIELNRRINQTLEEMAQALFKSWFVDFDPVKAKASVLEAGGTPQQAEQAAMQSISGKSSEDLESFQATHPDAYADLARTASLFPSRLVESELGPIPEGWSPKKWGELASLEYGKSLRDYQHSRGPYPVFGTNGPIGFHEKPLCESEGIIIGRKGAYRGVHYSAKPFFVIDTAFHLKPKGHLSLFWAYFELLRMDINGMDSGSAIPSTSRSDFYGVSAILPSHEICDSFQRTISRWFSAKEQNQTETEELTKVRDSLLPKLLSGEQEIPNELLSEATA